MTCTVDECSRPLARRGLCSMHYQRMRRYGDPTVFRPDARRGCLVEGCAGKHYGRGFCRVHLERLKKTGDPLALRPHFSPLAGKSAAENPAWVGDDAGYGAVHRRLRALRGPASGHGCSHCDAVAAHWAYDHTDAEERLSKEGPFSVDPDRYIPLCVPCHRRFDRAHEAARDHRAPNLHEAAG